MRTSLRTNLRTNSTNMVHRILTSYYVYIALRIPVFSDKSDFLFCMNPGIEAFSMDEATNRVFTVNPHLANPNTDNRNTANPNTANPNTANPNTAKPNTVNPTMTPWHHANK